MPRIYQDDMRRFITLWGFLRRVGKASQVALKLAWVIKKRRLASDVYGSQRMGPEWVFLHVRRCLNVLDLPPMLKKGAPKIFFFFNRLMQMCNRRERGVVRFKRYQQSYIKKWSQAFYYMQTTYIHFLLVLHVHHGLSGASGPWHVYTYAVRATIIWNIANHFNGGEKPISH